MAYITVKQLTILGSNPLKGQFGKANVQGICRMEMLPQSYLIRGENKNQIIKRASKPDNQQVMSASKINKYMPKVRI